jgi:phage-related holin
MKSILTRFVMTAGYEDLPHFMNSTFHPKIALAGLGFSGCLASIGYYFNLIFGIEAIVGICILVLFILEFYTGLTASRKEGKKFDSELFGKGWLKLFVYMIMIGVSHALALNLKGVSVLGYNFNVYEWMHGLFYNYVILNLFASNLENFKRLGWSEYIPVLNYLAKFVKDEPKTPKKNGKNT